MSDPIISVILTQLTTILDKQIRKEFGLVSGAEKEVKKLRTTFEAIKAVLVDAEKRQLKDQSVKLWLQNLKDISYDTEDVLSEWITAIEKPKIEALEKDKEKVRSFINLPRLGFNRHFVRRDIALKIKEINEKLDAIATEKDRYKFDKVIENENPLVELKTASYVVSSEVRGRDEEKSTLIRKLLADKNQENGLNVVSVIGMSGIGKTTLAQLVYNSNDVIQHFVTRIWVYVSDPFDEVRVAKAIVEDVEGKVPDLYEFEPLLRRVRNNIERNKFLLVLDDVWCDDHGKWKHLLDSLSVGASGSAILVTTRNERVAKMMRSIYELRLGELSSHDSWSLFSKIAFFGRSKRECELLEGVGRKIAKKCNGLPLCVNTIGGLMQVKSTLQDWERVLNSEFWELEEAEGIFSFLMLSYYDLPPAMKQCFSFCAFFPKDHVIEASNLIELWLSQGFLGSSEKVEMEVIAREYLGTLAKRSFFQVVKKEKGGERILSLKMHDMVHDFARYLTKNEYSIMEVNSDLERKTALSHKSLRHLTLVRAEDTRFPTCVPNVEKLRTFWVQSFYDSPPIVSQLDTIDPEIFRRLLCIRALDFSRNRIGELPNDIGKLVNLKYLNLSHNPFWELPPTLCDLYNLLSLKLSSCDHLRKLPPGIDKLTNLRHLKIDHTESLKAIPRGVGDLSSLITLSKFIILPGKETCGVEDLKDLNALCGSLKIEGLGYVADGDEAKQAELWKKSNISELHMDFGPRNQTRDHAEVIEALHPPESLQFLQISSYIGTKLPNWIVQLNNLEMLSLQDCQSCTELPPLGRLPSLSTLYIEGMNGVKCIGLEFMGFDVNDSIGVAFPKLKKLKISKMGSWEDWVFMSSGRDDENIKIMPRLRCLKISECSKLKALPTLLLRHTPLSKLRLHSCSLLLQEYHSNDGHSLSQVLNIPSSRIRIS